MPIRASVKPTISVTTAAALTQIGIYGFVGAEYAYSHRVIAFSSIFVLPILVLFLLLQKRIVAGLTAGALK
jgi:multiple sugar transport system permease protein